MLSISLADKVRVKELSSSIAWSDIVANSGASLTGVTVNVNVSVPDKTPSLENVSHSQGSTLNYSIELAMDNSSQQVDWYVDNVSTQVNSTSFTCCDDKTANYIVSAKIWDNTGTIRKDNSTSSSTINWSVNLEWRGKNEIYFKSSVNADYGDLLFNSMSINQCWWKGRNIDGYG